MSNTFNLGEKIRAFRKKKKLSLTDLSTLTGIAASNLSAIELNKSSPTLATLVKLADVFNMRVGVFLDEVLYSNVVVCSARKARLEDSVSRGCSVNVLTADVPMSNLQARAFLLELNSEPCPLDAEGADRFIYCVHGRVAVKVGNESFELESHDGLYLRSEVGGFVQNLAREEALVISIRVSSD